MKYYFLLLFFFILSAVFPQEKTLFDSNITSTGWFGSPVLKYTSILNKSSLLIGGRGGYIINHSIVVGGGMYGLVTDVPSKQGDLVNENINNLHLMYGGIELGYIFNPMEIIHYSFNTLLGIGRATDNQGEFIGDTFEHHRGQNFFVVEPKGAIEMNMTDYLRFEIGISYRIISGLEHQYLLNSDISGINGFLSINIGSF